MPTLCKRKTDGALFRPSFPDDYSDVQAIIDTLTGNYLWYFRRVELKKVRRWFWTRVIYEDTGEVWCPREGAEFDVIEA